MFSVNRRQGVIRCRIKNLDTTDFNFFLTYFENVFGKNGAFEFNLDIPITIT